MESPYIHGWNLPLLTHLFPMHPFSSHLKTNNRFSDVFRESRKCALETNGLIFTVFSRNQQKEFASFNISISVVVTETINFFRMICKKVSLYVTLVFFTHIHWYYNYVLDFNDMKVLRHFYFLFLYCTTLKFLRDLRFI